MTDILDTTLRDGSYAINFQFTAGDTAVIAAGLERAGVRMIEIGHGVGLGASEKGLGQAAESDQAYLKAAAEALTVARFGMFCIPGVASLEHVDLAADYGAGFIRVGTNVTEIDQAAPFVARARARGLFVAVNLMKSYAIEPPAFARKARQVQELGADVLYIVDSSGGMLPADVARYFSAVRDLCDVPLAFHGHDNLGLAMGNTCMAIELGAVIVDSSLQGLGRSAGNAATESLVATLARMGVDTGIDLLAVMDVGERYVRPLIRRRGLSSLDVTAGYAQFHSSYMGTIRRYATRYRIDPRRLIMALCEVDRVNAPEALVERLAERIKDHDDVVTARFEFDEYFGNEQAWMS